MGKRRPTTAMRTDIESLLVPGGGRETYVLARSAQSPRSAERWYRYSLLSSMSSAIRERADDQSRSIERSDVSSAAADSEVVKPAK